MKAYLPLIWSAGIVVLFFAVLFFVTPVLQSPEARLDEQIDEQLAKAQAMLAGFDPNDANLHRALQPSTTQPADDTTDPQYLDYLKKKSVLVSDALNVIRPAVALREEAGEQSISGANHAGATRFEAILYYYQGDVLRREAAAQRSIAEKASTEFGHWFGLWQEVDAQTRAMSREITPSTETAPADGASQIAAERIAELQKQREEVQAQIEQAKQQLAELTAETGEHQKQYEDAIARAETAQKRMLELEQKGIDATDPKSLPQFTTEYTAASDQYRRATREASVLLTGSAPEPKLNDREKEALTDPVVSIEPALQNEQRGLTALRTDLQSVQSLVETQTNVLAQIDQQIDKISKRADEIKTRIVQFEKHRSDLAANCLRAAKASIAARLEADRLENEAIELISNPGKAAAQRAKQAADNRANAARTLNSENPDSPNPRLTMITGDRFTSGHSQLVEADLDYLLALIQGQRYSDMGRHQHLIEQLDQLRFDTAVLLPEGVTADPANAWTTQLTAAQTAAETARTEGVKAAGEALEGYKNADADLNQLWSLHANMAAMNYLLSKLTPEAESKTHAASALRQYDLATRDRRDHPEARRYQRIMDDLKRTAD